MSTAVPSSSVTVTGNAAAVADGATDGVGDALDGDPAGAPEVGVPDGNPGDVAGVEHAAMARTTAARRPV
jgi:hypothetical protein